MGLLFILIFLLYQTGCDKIEDGILTESYCRYRKSFGLPSSWSFAGRFKKIGFGNNFIDQIKKLLTNQESYIIKGGGNTSYFKLENGACKGNPISAYFFIIAIEIIFAMIKSSPNIKGLNVFSHNYLYTTYADGATCF